MDIYEQSVVGCRSSPTGPRCRPQNIAMYVNNPYSSWSNPGNTQPTWGSDSAPAPSIFGALPAPALPSKSNLVTFHFTSFKPNILNSTVVGPDSRPYFRVVTDSSMPGYSVFRRESKNIALIEWQEHPQVELRDVLSKQAVSGWLGLSPDRRFVPLRVFSHLIYYLSVDIFSFRAMQINGQQYIWAPNHNFICVSHFVVFPIYWC